VFHHRPFRLSPTHVKSARANRVTDPLCRRSRARSPSSPASDSESPTTQPSYRSNVGKQRIHFPRAPIFPTRQTEGVNVLCKLSLAPRPENLFQRR